MKPVWGLINRHNRDRFEVHLFVDGAEKTGLDGYRKDPSDTLHSVGLLDCQQAAQRIRASGIDILVDLSGYSVPERLPLFLERVAPVTVGWFNAFATSGLPGFDFIVGDKLVIRKDEEAYYSEKVLRLPPCLECLGTRTRSCVR